MGRDIMDMNFLGPRIMDKLVLAFIVMSLYWRVGANQARPTPFGSSILCTHPKSRRYMSIPARMGDEGVVEPHCQSHGCQGRQGLVPHVSNGF